MSALKRIEVNRDLPRDVKSEFSVDGNAGQFLRVVVDENAEYDAPFSVSALAPDGSEIKPDDCVNDLAYPLPQTATYRVTFDPSGVEHTLRLTLLPHNDPLMDVDLKPEHEVKWGALGKCIDFDEMKCPSRTSSDMHLFTPYRRGRNCAFYGSAKAASSF